MANVFFSTVRISDERAIAPVVYRRAKVGQALAPEHHVVECAPGAGQFEVSDLTG
jgi:hypothetical protein